MLLEQEKIKKISMEIKHLKNNYLHRIEMHNAELKKTIEDSQAFIDTNKLLLTINKNYKLEAVTNNGDYHIKLFNIKIKESGVDISEQASYTNGIDLLFDVKDIIKSFFIEFYGFRIKGWKIASGSIVQEYELYSLCNKDKE